MLKPVEREKLQDCLLLIQSASSILSGIKDGLLPNIADVRKCLNETDRAIASLLRA